MYPAYLRLLYEILCSRFADGNPLRGRKRRDFKEGGKF